MKRKSEYWKQKDKLFRKRVTREEESTNGPIIPAFDTKDYRKAGVTAQRFIYELKN